MSKPRVTVAQLEAAIALLNKMTNNPDTPYSRTESGTVANVGNYHLSRAYGGFALHQMANTGGGIRDVLRTGHVPARQLFDLIHAYRYGAELTEQANKRMAALEQDKLTLMRDILAPLAV